MDFVQKLLPFTYITKIAIMSPTSKYGMIYGGLDVYIPKHSLSLL